jgi:3-hydroxy-9,10-secoandrosta-1,3,5(10)-triene-9,17-dione monooxygenase
MTTAAFRRLAVPSPDELVERARGMVPEIRALAEETERNRKIAPHIIDKFREAELLRTSRPKEFGGFEYDGETALRIALTISAACASTGWAVNGAVSNGRSMSHFPIETQREIWSTVEDPFSCACFAPTGTAVPVDGGYILNGHWSFASGCDHASWAYLGAFIAPEGGKPTPEKVGEGAFFLLPIGDCEIIDNWFVNGLAGTGSKDIAVHDVFVPARRILLFSDARAGTTPGAAYHRNPIYRMPLLINGASMLASTAVGAARSTPISR